MSRHSRMGLRDFLVAHSQKSGMIRARSVGHVEELQEVAKEERTPVEDFTGVTSLAEMRRPWLSTALYELDGAFKERSIYPASVAVFLMAAYLGVMYQFQWENIDYGGSGDPFGDAGWYVPVIATILYLLGIHLGIRIMDKHEPPKFLLREFMIGYNGYQTILSMYMAFFTFYAAREAGFTLWGNGYDPSRPIEKKLGMMIWMHYFNHTIEMADIIFIILRKRWEDITAYRIFTQLTLLWAWFFVVKYYCGGDAYFAVISQSIVRFCTYSYYGTSLMLGQAMPSWWKRGMTAVQLSQYGLCLCHATYVIHFKRGSITSAAFWLVVLEWIVMASLLAMFSNFQLRQHLLEENETSDAEARALSKKRRFVVSYDSSAWMYLYHFGVAYFVQKHITDKMDKDRVAYSGVSGGALVALVSILASNQAKQREGGAVKYGVANFDVDSRNCSSANVSRKHTRESDDSDSDGRILRQQVKHNPVYGDTVWAYKDQAFPNIVKVIVSKRKNVIPRVWRILQQVEDVLEEYCPPDAHVLASGRMRVMATRVGFHGNMYPVKGEVLDNFKNRDHVMKMVRASCHIPLVGGILPYDTGFGWYYDGFAWCNSFCVPWRSFRTDDYLVKVSAIGLPNVDIKPPWVVPIWWIVFPPKEEILWGIFAQGYYDACAFFQDVGLPWDDMPHTSEEANWKLPNGADRHLAMHHVKRSWLVFGSLVFTLMALTIHTYFPFVSLALMCWSLISPYDIPSMPSLPTLLLVPLTMYLFYQEQYVHYDVESFKDFTAYELWRGLWPVIMYCVVRFKFYILLVMVCMVLSDWSPYMLWTRMLSFAFLCGLRLLISLIYFQEAEDFKEKYYKKYF